MIMHIELQNASGIKTIPSKKNIKTWVTKALNLIPDKIPAEQAAMTIRIVDKDESAYLNSTFRHKQGPTNVLAFEDHPLGELPAESLGDLAICAEVVAEEAQQQQKSLEAHWAHLVIHGFLHLVGYDHQEEREAKTMEALESNILITLGFNDPYQDH